MLHRLASTAIALTTIICMGAGPLDRKAPPNMLRQCGYLYADPIASPLDSKRRECGPAGERRYTPRNRGLGFEILDIESEACFVPDDAYRLLDDVIDEVVKQLPSPVPQDTQAKIDYVLAASRTMGNVLEGKGFELNIPTYTLSDALLPRNTPRKNPRHIFDCDTGSMMLLTIAEKLAIPAFMVEMQLSGDSWHNYVRWQIDANTTVDWDTNGRDQCVTPPNMPALQGVSMSRDQTLAYVLRLRGGLWSSRGVISKAFDDYRASIRLFPEHPVANNGFAWFVATKGELPDREKYLPEALKAATQAVAVRPIAGYLDTLACVHAFAKDFNSAIRYQTMAVQNEPTKAIFSERLEMFKATPPRDCTGAD